MGDADVRRIWPLSAPRRGRIYAPMEKVDSAGWLMSLPDAEYQRCAPPDHIAAGTTKTDDGRPMSINVEQVGGALVVQRYVAEVARSAPLPDGGDSPTRVSARSACPTD